jgi:cation diffusion facilitator CzcD-associated flavoprotein CzcO
MKELASVSFAAVLALTAACNAEIGKGKEASKSEAGTASAEGKAQENSFSVNVPGFDMKVAIREGIRNNAEIDSDGEMLYPGATFSGMHVEGGGEGKSKDAGVEIRFTSADAPEKIAAWYRDPARKDISVTSAAQEGDAFVIAGQHKKEGDQFKIRLTPKANGGTDGRLAIQSSG